MVPSECPDGPTYPDETNAEVLAEGTLLGAYRIVRCIGSGGMGAVYEAEHSALQKRVALKVPCLAGSTEEGRARFVQEGKMAARIRHPNVVDITDVGASADVAYLVMEYLDGEPLSQLIGRDGPLEPRLVADIFVPVAAALQEAHRMGIVHRDLKPDNIFVTRSVHGNIQPKVLDFGISKALDQIESPHLTRTNVLLGTPQYLSPEQLQSAQWATAKSDQYTLGVVMYEAATGAQPFGGYSSLLNMIKAIGSGDRKRAKDTHATLDVRLAAIIERAMCVSPEGRFESMTSLGAQLLPMASSDTVNMWARHFRTPTPAPVAPANPLQKVARWTLACGVAALLCSLASRVASTRQSPQSRAVRAAVSEASSVGTSSAPLLPLPLAPDTTREAPQRSQNPESKERSKGPTSATYPAAGGRQPVTKQRVVKRNPRQSGKAEAPEATALNAHELTSPAVSKPDTARLAEEPSPALQSGPLGSDSLPTDNIDPWQP